MDFGIDISHFNRVDDWNAVHGNNISFASVKVTESTDFVDNAAAGHVEGARAAGIHVGGYHFARDTSVAAQAAHFTERLRSLSLTGPGSLAPMIDIEATELRDNANPFVSEFISRLRSDAGVRRVLVYANLDFFRHVLRPDEWADEDVSLWIARFNGDPGNPGWDHPNLALHQHSNQGNVPGIPGHVDRDATVGSHTVSNVLVAGEGGGAGPMSEPDTYVVQPGDNLTKIARRFNTTVEALVALNNIANPDLIFPNQVLRLR
jgi:GH25 family lysozyme M1 (1,4-beta-N-acetylmuramidase)